MTIDSQEAVKSKSRLKMEEFIVDMHNQKSCMSAGHIELNSKRVEYHIDFWKFHLAILIYLSCFAYWL